MPSWNKKASFTTWSELIFHMIIAFKDDARKVMCQATKESFESTLRYIAERGIPTVNIFRFISAIQEKWAGKLP